MARRAKMNMDKDMMHQPGMGKGMGLMMCCGSWFGIVHILGGAGIALLLVSYFNVPDIMFWGWVLLGAAVLGHFWKMMMWKKMI